MTGMLLRCASTHATGRGAMGFASDMDQRSTIIRTTSWGATLAPACHLPDALRVWRALGPAPTELATLAPSGRP